jgi:signal peptidase I
MPSVEALPDAHSIKQQLAADRLRYSKALRLSASGWSMLPTIWPGDTLAIEKSASLDVVEGDIVAFSRGGRFVAHRVMKKCQASESVTLQTRGDALLEPDSPISDSDLLGKVTHVLRNGRCIEPLRNLHPSNRAFAVLLQHSPLAVRAVLRIHRIVRTALRSHFNDRAVPCQS